MIDRRQRRALPAGSAIGGAQVVDHVEPREPRQTCPIADLNRQPPLGRMQHGVAMKADDADCRRVEPMLPQELRNGLRMALGQPALDLTQAAGPGVPVGEAARRLDRPHQRGPELPVIGKRVRRPSQSGVLPVRVDQRHVDAVHGRAAHQADCAHRLAHGWFPVLFPVLPTLSKDSGTTHASRASTSSARGWTCPAARSALVLSLSKDGPQAQSCAWTLGTSPRAGKLTTWIAPLAL